jgi:hypothetical protein
MVAEINEWMEFNGTLAQTSFSSLLFDWMVFQRGCIDLAGVTNSKQTVEKGPSASLRSTASLRRTTQIRLRSSVSCAPRIWDLFDRSENRVLRDPLKKSTQHKPSALLNNKIV